MLITVFLRYFWSISLVEPRKSSSPEVKEVRTETEIPKPSELLYPPLIVFFLSVVLIKMIGFQ